MSATPSLLDKDAVLGINKILITVGVMAAIGITGYLVYKGIKNAKSKADSKREDNDTKNELNRLIVQGIKPTLNQTQISGIANALFGAMDGYGTNYDTVAREFAKINNDADMLSVAKAYGVREVSSGRLNPEPNFTGTLQAALKSELSSSEISAINGVLARKGIKNRL